MMKLINKYYLYVFSGFLIVIFLLWNRIFRFRLPKNIPLDLTDIEFICLFLIILILLISLFKSVYFYLTKNNNNTFTISYLYNESLERFDIFIKGYSFIWTNIRSLHLFLFKQLHRCLSYKKIIYIIFQMPKIILPLILCYEVFFTGTINNFYKALILLLIPLIYRYIFHSLHLFYVTEIHKLDSILKITFQNISDKGEILHYAISAEPMHYFIQETTLDRIGIRENEKEFNITLSDIYIEQHPDIDLQEVFDSCYKLLSVYSSFYEVLYTHTMLKKQYDRPITIFMLILYIVCWSYILLVSTSFENVISIHCFLIETLKNISEPFSGSPIWFYYNSYENSTNCKSS